MPRETYRVNRSNTVDQPRQISRRTRRGLVYGYIAYPLGVKGVVVGQGNSYKEALSDVTSAIKAYVEEFGIECLSEVCPAKEAFIDPSDDMHTSRYQPRRVSRRL